MSAWEQKRELFLRLGTETYQKPTQLPSCDRVLDFAENKLTNAENYVEPLSSDDVYLHTDEGIYLCPFPFPKEGFRSRSKFYRNQVFKESGNILVFLFENPVQNQESIAWVESRLKCKSYLGKTGQPIFTFKNYLVSYIHSIDPNFQDNEILKALYVTTDGRAGGFIYTSTPEASSELKRILYDRNISDMFPGMKNLKILRNFTLILRVEFG